MKYEDPRIEANRRYAEMARAAEADCRSRGDIVSAVFVYAPMAKACEDQLARLRHTMTEAEARAIVTCASCGLNVASHDVDAPHACASSACAGFRPGEPGEGPPVVVIGSAPRP